MPYPILALDESKIGEFDAGFSGPERRALWETSREFRISEYYRRLRRNIREQIRIIACSEIPNMQIIELVRSIASGVPLTENATAVGVESLFNVRAVLLEIAQTTPQRDVSEHLKFAAGAFYYCARSIARELER